MVSNELIAQITGASADKANAYGPLLNDAMVKFEINTPARVLAFLSQIGHESGALKYKEEIASGSAYEGRKDLGNTQPGDGVRFKGRGFIQITGRANYKKVSEAMGQDFTGNPPLLADPKWAAMASAWWWKNRGLNEVADKMDVQKGIDDPNNLSVFRLITKKINGGYNGIEDRIKRWKAGQVNMAKAALNWIKKNPVKAGIGGAATLVITALIVIGTIWAVKQGTA